MTDTYLGKSRGARRSVGFFRDCASWTLIGWADKLRPHGGLVLKIRNEIITLHASLCRLNAFFVTNECFFSIVNCPRGYFYDSATSTCKKCAVGFISSAEGSLQCTKCPSGSSTLKEGSKTCTGNESGL